MQRKCAVFVGKHAHAIFEKLEKDENAYHRQHAERDIHHGNFKAPHFLEIKGEKESYDLVFVDLVNDTCMKEGSLEKLKEIVKKAEFVIFCPRSLKSRSRESELKICNENYHALTKFSGSDKHADIRVADPDLELGDKNRFESLIKKCFFYKDIVSMMSQFRMNASAMIQKAEATLSQGLGIVRLR